MYDSKLPFRFGVRFGRFLSKYLAAVLLIGITSSVGAQEQIDFDLDVRPILADACFRCHGPDEKTREADLRLDQEEGLFADRGGYAAVQPGDVPGSEILVRLRSQDEGRMPPAESQRQLTAEEVATLEMWVSQGAKWQEHWAFRPPIARQPPVNTNQSWDSNPIDSFVRSRRDGSWSSSTEAEPTVLLRRVWFDLVGLPPSPDDVERFLEDPAPDRFERQMDRLLASPHYGEKMARGWLDAARYADTNGYQYDTERTQWPWRDWVIEAFNRHVPYDEFVIEQLAGDLLPNATPQQVLATGFNRNHGITIEGGVIDEEYRTEYVADRVVTTTTVFLGLTALCARCHDHKYDPLSQKEFYQLFDFFNQVPEKGHNGFAPQLAVQPAELEQRRQQLDDLKKELLAQEPQWVAKQELWEQKLRERKEPLPVLWHSVALDSISAKSGSKFIRQDDGSWLAQGGSQNPDQYDLIWKVPSDGEWTWLRLQALTHPDLPHGGPGRAFNSNYVLSEIKLFQREGDLWSEVQLASAVADYSQSGFEISQAIDGNGATGWAVDGPTRKENRVAGVRLTSPLRAKAGSELKLELHFNYGSAHSIGRVGLAMSQAESPQLSDDPWQALAIAAQDRNLQQAQDLRELFVKSGQAPEKLVEQLVRQQQLESEIAELAKRRVNVMVMRDMPNRRPTRILERGSYDQPRGEVLAGIPEVLGGWEEDFPKDRLGLARWLVASSHPLTSRVAVNRWWQECFGVGLVKSSEDFGTQGERPSHPELLDWLAVNFQKQDWELTWLQRKMMSSATYRQSSDVSPEKLADDPENRWLQRGPARRLNAEEVRDTLLTASGQLIPKIGGPSVYPYHPEGLWLEINNRPNYSKAYPHQGGEGLYRRSLYTFWKRTVPPPTMQTFDAPEREFCVVRRSATNTPLQAFVLLHDPQFVEAARQLAIRVLHHSPDQTDSQRLRFACLATLGRPPAPQEAEILLEMLERRRADYKTNEAEVDGMLGVGESETPIELSRAEVAAWTVIARLLMNLSETITRG
jgi:hypothetical protein